MGFSSENELSVGTTMRFQKMNVKESKAEIPQRGLFASMIPWVCLTTHRVSGRSFVRGNSRAEDPKPSKIDDIGPG